MKMKMKMKVRKESSRFVKPTHKSTPPTPLTIPLSVLDKTSYNTHIAIIFAFRPPIPPNSAMETGLAKTLSEYREFAGRLGLDPCGNPIITLNDEGVWFVEASLDSALDRTIMPFKPSPVLLSLHPRLHGVEALAQVQLTRFACGSLVVGFTAHHQVADGHATSNFLVAWGLATRGLAIGSLPMHDRITLFVPRDPPRVEHNHSLVEFAPRKLGISKDDPMKDDVVVHRVHFTKDFLAKLKDEAAIGSARRHSTFESLVAHLWRVVTRARGLMGSESSTRIRISVNGRMRLSPKVPDEYFGNLVLWAFPHTTVGKLLSQPLQHAALLIRDAVARVDDTYFRSFIDFAASGVVEEEGLVSTADMNKSVLCPDLEVDSWLRFPFCDVDFGGGCPCYFMPTYFAVEGMVFLLPSIVGDGSIDVCVPLFKHDLPLFRDICYSLD